ncbi:Splicing factor 1 [Gracilaria domingensis]|nr:Splicing factor 1 [Gracilaria domingensis]
MRSGRTELRGEEGLESESVTEEMRGFPRGSGCCSSSEEASKAGLATGMTVGGGCLSGWSGVGGHTSMPVMERMVGTGERAGILGSGCRMVTAPMVERGAAGERGATVGERESGSLAWHSGGANGRVIRGEWEWKGEDVGECAGGQDGGWGGGAAAEVRACELRRLADVERLRSSDDLDATTVGRRGGVGGGVQMMRGGGWGDFPASLEKSFMWCG